MTLPPLATFVNFHVGRIEHIPSLSGSSELDRIQLRYVNLSVIKELPEGYNVPEIDLTGNALVELPSSFAKLTRLRHLYIDYNQFTAFPTVLCQIPHLETLRISGNRLTKLPDCVGNITYLEHLFIEGNSIKHLPKSIQNLKNLCTLGILGNGMAHEDLFDLKKANPRIKWEDGGSCHVR